MSASAHFIQELDMAHQERMRRLREKEAANKTSVDRLETNCRVVCKVLVWTFVGLCGLYFTYGVAVGMGWIK